MNRLFIVIAMAMYRKSLLSTCLLFRFFFSHILSWCTYNPSYCFFLLICICWLSPFKARSQIVYNILFLLSYKWTTFTGRFPNIVPFHIKCIFSSKNICFCLIFQFFFCRYFLWFMVYIGMHTERREVAKLLQIERFCKYIPHSKNSSSFMKHFKSRIFV